MACSAGPIVQCRGGLPWRGGAGSPAYAVLRALGSYGPTKLVQKDQEAGVVLTGLGIGQSRCAAAPAAEFGWRVGAELGDELLQRSEQRAVGSWKSLVPRRCSCAAWPRLRCGGAVWPRASGSAEPYSGVEVAGRLRLGFGGCGSEDRGKEVAGGCLKEGARDPGRECPA